MRQRKMLGKLSEPTPRPASGVMSRPDPDGCCFLKLSISFSLVLLYGFFCLSSPKSAAQLTSATIKGTQKENGKYTVKGKVLNSVTGHALRGAVVKLEQRTPNEVREIESKIAISGTDGEFEFDDVPKPTRISVEKSGFVAEPRVRSAFNGAEPYEVESQDGEIILRLAPEGIINVHVENTEGQSIQGAKARIIERWVDRGRKRWTVNHFLDRGLTDAHGNLRITQLIAGKYRIGIEATSESAARMSVAGQGNKTGYPILVYYPNRRDIESAQPLDVKPGQQFSIRFSLKRERLFRVAGKVIGKAADPRPSGRSMLVQMFDSSGSDERSSAVFADSQTGEFDMGTIAAGTYVLRCQNMASGGNMDISDVTLNITSDRTNIVAPLRSGLSIPVVYRFDDVNPSGQKTMNSSSVLLNARAALRSSSFSGPSYDSDTNSFGTSIHKVLPGAYAVKAFREDGVYVQSLRYGPVDLLQDDLVVKGDVPTLPIEVVVRNDPATLAGKVISEGTDGHRKIIVMPTFAPTQTEAVEVSPTGEFQVAGLAPGDYRVFAFDAEDEVEYMDPAVMAQLASRATSVTLYANQKASISLAPTHEERNNVVAGPPATAIPQPDEKEDSVDAAEGVMPPRVISKPEPEYVDSKNGVESDGSVGFVGISVVVDENGRVGAMRIVKALGLGLDERALNSLHNWQFEPAHKDGKPVSAEIRVEVEFRRR